LGTPPSKGERVQVQLDDPSTEGDNPIGTCVERSGREAVIEMDNGGLVRVAAPWMNVWKLTDPPPTEAPQLERLHG